MKSMGKGGTFLGLTALTVLMNLAWTIPAWILLALHFIYSWSILWFWLALGIWFVSTLVWMGLIAWGNHCSNIPDPPKENKNPYSVKKQTEES